MTDKVDLPIDELLALRAKGHALSELADHFACSASTVKRNLDAAQGASPQNEPDLSWQEQALCAQTDPESFFPEKGGSTRAAKAVCGRCTVAAECLDFALAGEERFGIWGGLSERDRRNLSKQLAKEAS